MRIQSIDFKNICSFGEEMQHIDYTNTGKLIQLKGISGNGKSTILQLPSLLLYGKIDKVPKPAIANRINKNGYIKGTIVKGQHTYVIERTFTPNTITVYKDGQNIENYGSRDAQAFLDKEVIEIPIQTFNNMISISMGNFKSFLTMSPADRKQIIDRVFNLEVINVVFENIKKDMRELGVSINSDNSLLYSLNQNIQNANNEIIKIQEKLKTTETQKEIDENNQKIQEINEKINTITEAYKNTQEKQLSLNTEISTLKQQQIENDMNIRNIQNQLALFSQEKCPTCGTSFNSDNFKELKNKLVELKNEKMKIKTDISDQLSNFNTNLINIQNLMTKANTTMFNLKTEITNLQNKNYVIQEKLKSNTEYQAVLNIINKTTEDVNNIKQSIDKKNNELSDLQNLLLVYSIDGVKQKVINNYLPLLNAEILNNLELMNFPYMLEFDSKFDPHLKDLGQEIPTETLSAGESTRVNLVILCSLYKLLKRRYTEINILSVDEVVSVLDNWNSGIVLKFLKDFSLENNLNCFVVSHTDLEQDAFDEILEINKNVFSSINKLTLTL